MDKPNDTSNFTENFIRTFPVRKFILCFLIVAVLLYFLTPVLRDLDYGRMPVSSTEFVYQPGHNKVVVVEGNVNGDGKYLDNVALGYDSVNCYPQDGRRKMAGYWTTEQLNVKFNAIWVVGGC